jgi:hypothetical protein
VISRTTVYRPAATLTNVEFRTTAAEALGDVMQRQGQKRPFRERHHQAFLYLIKHSLDLSADRRAPVEILDLHLVALGLQAGDAARSEYSPNSEVTRMLQEDRGRAHRCGVELAHGRRRYSAQGRAMRHAFADSFLLLVVVLQAS